MIRRLTTIGVKRLIAGFTLAFVGFVLTGLASASIIMVTGDPPPPTPVTSTRTTSCGQVGDDTEIFYDAPSGPSFDITFTIDGVVDCYQFANGDWGVVGPVDIVGITPAHTAGCVTGSGTCSHGWQVGLNGFDQALDSRDASFDETFSGGNFPQTIAAGSSVIKGVSDTVNSCPGDVPGQECLQFAAIFTVLDAAPADAGDTFRPPPYTTPAIATTATFSGLNLASITKVDDSGMTNVPTTAAMARRFQHFQIEARANFQGRRFHAEDNYQQEEYHGPIAQSMSAAMFWLTLDSTDETNANDKEAMAVIIQAAYDIADLHASGCDPCWFDHSNGRLAFSAMAATLIGEQRLIDGTQNYNGSRERVLVSIQDDPGEAGIALFGLHGASACTDATYWTYQATSSGTQFCGDPTGQIDGPPVYITCCLNGGLVGGPLAVMMLNAETAYDSAALLEFGPRWFNDGYHGLPDTCLADSQGGGANGTGACITGATSSTSRHIDVPPNATDGTQADLVTANIGIFNSFYEEYKDDYYACAQTDSCT